MSTYSSDKVNAFLLKEVYREELKEWFEKIEGTKALVLEDNFNSTFDLIVDNSFLKECGIVHRTTLSSTKRLPKSQNVIFICKPSINVVDIIGTFIEREESGKEFSNKSFHLLFIPKKSLLCEKRLKEVGLVNSLTTIDHIEMEAYPLTSDLFSLQWSNAYKECFLEQDTSCLFHVCKALMSLQSIFGPIPNLYAKGHLSSRVIDMLKGMQNELNVDQTVLTSKIDNLILIDRNVDSLTPLLTPLTYEGLIDELYGIHQGVVELPADRFTNDQEPGDASQNPFDAPTLKRIHLGPFDDLYSEIRDKNFNAVGNCINQRVKELSNQYDERHAAKTVGEIKKFVSKIAHIRATKANLATHTAIAEMIKEVTDGDDFRGFLGQQQECLEGDAENLKDYIEESIAQRRPIIQVLRLICLQCYVSNGLKPKLLDFYRRELIQTYGYEHIVSLHNIESCGLLYTQSVARNYNILKRQLKLTVKNVNEQCPDDISYVFSGYAPISVRLAQILNKSGWRSIAEVVNTALPGAVREESQVVPEWLLNKQSSEKGCKVSLVFFIGGITFAEVSALRFLSQQDESTTEYLIGSTNMISSTSYLQSIMHPLKVKPPNPFL